MDRIFIFDTTLRDGEQAPGASLNAKEKLEIAHQLKVLGVDAIEAGGLEIFRHNMTQHPGNEFPFRQSNFFVFRFKDYQVSIIIKQITISDNGALGITRNIT